MITSSYLELTRQLLKVENAIRCHPNKGLQVFTPSINDFKGEEPRELVIKSIRRMRANPTVIKSGLLCATPSTIQAIEELNNAKDHFKKTVSLIKGNVHKSSQTIQRLIQFDASIIRDEDLRRALRAIGGQSFDLRTCYAKIQVLPKQTTSVSWTWAMRHKRIKKYTVDEAFQLTQSMVNDNAKLAAEIQLQRLPKDEVLIQKLDIPPQLKANIKYLEKGREFRKCITVSGVLALQQNTLPIYLWREQPETENIRLSRPTKSEATFFVPTLKMYRYADA